MPITTTPTSEIMSLDTQSVEISKYVLTLRDAVKCLSAQVQEALLKDPDRIEPTPVEVGVWILRKVLHRDCSSPRWTGPFRVVKPTDYMVKVEIDTDKHNNWRHKSCTKTNPPKDESLLQKSENLAEVESDSDEEGSN